MLFYNFFKQQYQKMRPKHSEQQHWLPQSKYYHTIKQVLDRIEKRLNQDTQITKDKKQNYVRVIRQMNYTIGKCQSYWPRQVDKIMDNLCSVLGQFDKQLIAMSKGSSFFCGSGGNEKQLQNTFKRLVGYQHLFEVIRPFQDRQIKEDIITIYEEQVQQNKGNTSRSNVNSVVVQQQTSQQPQQPQFVVQNQSPNQPCQYCELMKASTICPNGYIAKKLIKQLDDTEWIAGILHQEGTIVDKDINKAIEYYKIAYKKGNYEALYRLGSLNERGLYGKPFDYIKMWEEASGKGHLQAMTDLGYLYENGLQDEETNRLIISPDSQRAFDYYSRAAKSNFPRALNNLATFYFSNETFRDEKKCLQYLQAAAEAQYVKALHNLGVIYYEGKMVKEDMQKSRSLVKRAAQKGDLEGRVLYVEMMLNEVVQCNEDTLVELNKYCRQIVAKDEENPEAYYFLGVMNQEGYGVQKQPSVAFLYYTVAAGLKSEAALMKLGECYRTGFGVEPDLSKAINYFKQATQTNKMALISLGQIYEKGGQDLQPHYERAFQYYYDACNYNLPQAYKHVGNMYKQGRHVRRNEQKAEQYYQKARALDHQQQPFRRLTSSSSDLIQSSYYRRR